MNRTLQHSRTSKFIGRKNEQRNDRECLIQQKLEEGKRVYKMEGIKYSILITSLSVNGLRRQSLADGLNNQI